MKRAVLNYVIKCDDGSEKYLQLDTSSLYEMDLFTSKFKDDNDLFNHLGNKGKILEFIRNNNAIGKFVITYVSNVYSKKDIKPLFNYSKKISINDDYSNNDVSEVEKARKLLFNSHGQLFAKLLLFNKDIPECYNYRFSITYQEYLHAIKNGLEVVKKEDSYYISFYELLKYRATHRKLGALRNVYEDMLDVWKRKLDQLNDEDYYYYCRQLRLIMNDYDKMKSRHFALNNLKLRKENYKSICNNFVLNYKPKYYRVSRNVKFKKKKYIDVA